MTHDHSASDPKPFWIAGSPRTGDTVVTVKSPFDGAVAGSYYVPTAQDVEQAVAGAHDSVRASAALPASARAAALDHISRQIAARGEEIASVITAENGKPIMWANAEVGRAVSTFRWAAEEARRWSGDLQRLDTDPAAAGRLALVRRFSKGPILGIAPFNFPLNLVAHKVAPAIAIGAPIIIKPAPATPLSALILGEIMAETDLPVGSWSVLPIGNDETRDLVQDERLPVISFTGSETVGYAIQAAVPRKHVTLELGGNAAAVVLEDWSSSEDLEWAATRAATFANYQAGQSCISVQRVIVDATLAERFVPLLTQKVRELTTGSPWDEKTVVGPVINEAAAIRIEEWVAEAKAQGANVVLGGGRDGCQVEPTLITDAPQDARVLSEEVFGPVLVVTVVDGVDEAFEAVNASRFGLQAGIFTHNVQYAFSAFSELEVGGVIVGDVPSFRADQMPYGGVKSSGVGREGVRAAMEDLSYEKTMVLTGIDL